MPYKLTRKLNTLVFIPERYRSQNHLDFGQMPLKDLTTPSKDCQSIQKRKKDLIHINIVDFNRVRLLRLKDV